MNKALVLIAVLLCPNVLMAQDFDYDSLLGTEWFGLYMNGSKAGYAFTEFSKDDQGRYIVTEDARFQLNMLGVKQDLRTATVRVYAPNGELISISSDVVDPTSNTRYVCQVVGDQLVQKTIVFDEATEVTLPKPKETLADARRHQKWVLSKPSVDDTMAFTIYEPLYKKDIAGLSRIIAIEERSFEGVPTKVYKIRTTLDLMDIDSITYVTEEGTTLEDVIASLITMRLEPEDVAKDVDYSNDVIISNAAMLDEPLQNPRKRKSLRLAITGPLTEDHMFNDERQFFRSENDQVIFESTQVALDDFIVATLPITDSEVLRWTKATDLVQSDHPDMLAKAKEIVGDEGDILKINEKLCSWVYSNVKDTFSARLTNAREVLNSLEGDCTEHSILFIALTRALGIPAREAAGLIYVGGDTPGFYFHQWAKVWVGKWIDVDPTFNQPLADVTHIRLAEGDLYNQARLIPIIGRLKIEVLPEDE